MANVWTTFIWNKKKKSEYSHSIGNSYVMKWANGEFFIYFCSYANAGMIKLFYIVECNLIDR